MFCGHALHIKTPGMKDLLALLVCCLAPLCLSAQQLDKLSEEEPVTFSGSLYLMTLTGITKRRKLEF